SGAAGSRRRSVSPTGAPGSARRHRSSAELVEREVEKLVRVLLQEEEMAVAVDAAVGEEEKVGLGAPRAEQLDGLRVDLARMRRILGTGQVEHAEALERFCPL